MPTNPITYTIPLSTPGSYTVTLKFNEPTKTAANQRKFDVSLEGSLALDDFDIYAVNNSRNTAVDRSFLVSVTDGALNVTFGRVTDYPIISAIEVLWAGSSPATPSVSYTYRGDGLRNSKTVTSTITYTWDINSGLPVVLQDGSETYAYGVGGLISQTDGSGNQSYFLGNGLGSTEKLTDGSGNIVASYKYDIFGAVRASTGSGSAEYRFTGQQDDATLGYTYLWARYYDRQTGRFLSKDPFPGTLANPASQHYYGYAQNNPVNWTDPSGLETWGIGIGGSVGAVFGAHPSQMLVWDDSGNVAILLSEAVSLLGPASAFVGGIAQHTSAQSICSLPSPTTFVGGSAGEGFGAGVDLLFGTNPDGSGYWGAQVQVGYTFKLPWPAEGHIGIARGRFRGFQHNPELAKWLTYFWNLLIERRPEMPPVKYM